MDRSIAIGNRICAKRQEELRRFRHNEKLNTTAPNIDNAIPVTLTLSHLKVNMKREQMQEDRFMEVDRSNRVMMQRIADLARKPGLGLQMMPGSRGMPSLNHVARRKSLKRITDENQAILRRIRDIQPQYDHVRWEQDYRRTRLYLKNACEFPVDRKQAPLPLSDEPFPIPSLFTHHFSKEETIVPIEPSLPQVMVPVAKQGKRFDDTFYLLEVFVREDGSLTVTAFSGQEPELELHVAKSDEADYGKLLDRIQISKGKIFL